MVDYTGPCMQLEDYQEELEEMKNMTRQEYVAHLRRYCTLVFLSSTTILSCASITPAWLQVI